jgi:hypothetical protein
LQVLLFLVLVIGLHAEGGNAYSLEDDLQLEEGGVVSAEGGNAYSLEDDLQLEEGVEVSAEEGSYWTPSGQEERWGKSLGKEADFELKNKVQKNKSKIFEKKNLKRQMEIKILTWNLLFLNEI